MKFGTAALLTALALTAWAPFSSSAATTTQYVAYSSHTDSACSTTPKQVAYLASSDCTTTTDTACVADASTGLYVTKSCVADPATRSASVFGSNPWIQFDIYQPSSSCGTLASVVGYLADGSCLSVDNGASSIVAKVLSDKSVTVTTYSGTSCSGTPTNTNSIASNDLARTTCIKGLVRAYTSATVSVSAQSNDAHRPARGVLGGLLLTVVAMAMYY